MLNQERFNEWCRQTSVSEEAQQVIEQIRSSDPSRRVGGGRQNVSGRYPSRKMGTTIQFESHKVELPYIYQLEHDEDVLEFYDQPPAIKISYQSSDGRTLSFFYTPDFFVVRRQSAEWVECKAEEQLQKLSEKNPNRYFLGEDNQWHSPPGEKYAEQFGLNFHVFSDADIDWILQRNITFLDDYYIPLQVKEEAVKIILSLVSAQPGITLTQLTEHAKEVTPDDVYAVIAHELVFVDLNAAPLVEPERCFVFQNPQVAQAYRATVLSQSSSESIRSSVIDLQPGTCVMWDGKILKIIFVGETEILLNTEDKQSVELERDTFEQLANQGKIKGIKQIESVISSEVVDILKKASEGDLREANRRYRLLEPKLAGGVLDEASTPKRTIRYWYANYRLAEQKYGYGFIGLLPDHLSKGNRNPKLPQHLLEQIDKFINDDYENHKQKRKFEAYAAFCYACSSAAIPEQQIPSYKTFIKYVKKRSGYDQTLKREGHRAAYSKEPFYFELEMTTPRHGDRPFEIAHIDHTQFDIELRCSTTGRVLGRPWGTFLVDANSRRLLAVYLTYDEPSYRSCVMVLRICVKRHGRLPQIIITDNGSEFHSIYFETLLAFFGCTHKYRPPAKARFGSVCERLFATSATQLLYSLTANTQIMKRVRVATKSVNPKNLALWTLGCLYLYLCEWAYEIYDTIEHPSLGQSPRDAFNSGLTRFGNRSPRIIPYDESFRILTLPTTRNGKAKVQPNLGIKANQIYYWSNAFRDPKIEKKWVDVRYDPFDAGIAYAYVHGQWVECLSEHYAVFQGRSEKEIRLATAELRRRNQNHSKNLKVTAKQIGAFLARTSGQEDFLTQRLLDAQNREVFQVIDGGIPNQTPYSQKASEPNNLNSRDNTSNSLFETPRITPPTLDELKGYEEY